MPLNEGDIVPYSLCGCRTTIAAAQKLGRERIGIDVTHLSGGLMKLRLKKLECVPKPTGSPYLHRDQTASHYFEFRGEKWRNSLFSFQI